MNLAATHEISREIGKKSSVSKFWNKTTSVPHRSSSPAISVPNLLHHQDVGVHFGDCPLDVLGVLGGGLPAGPRAHAGKPLDVPRHEAEFPGKAGSSEQAHEDGGSKKGHFWKFGEDVTDSPVPRRDGAERHASTKTTT
jgi:hypothetical protein